LEQPELVILLRHGDPSAFKQLVDDNEGLVYNTALGIVQNEDDADDITQEVFIQAYQSVSSFKGDSKLSTWLYRITVNKSLDHERRKKRRKGLGFLGLLSSKQEMEMRSIPEFSHPGVLLEKKESAADLFRALKLLPENQRVAFTLHKLEGQAYKDIAEIMNISLQAVESLMARARRNLEKILGDSNKNERR